MKREKRTAGIAAVRRRAVEAPQDEEEVDNGGLRIFVALPGTKLRRCAWFAHR